MTGLAPVTIEGRVGKDPELRFIPAGAAVCNFSLAHTERKREGDQWVDGQTIWFDITCWRQLAENVSESIRRGDLVIVHGDLSQDTYTPRDGGGERTKVTITAKYVGPSLTFRTATVNRADRQQQPGQQPGGQWQQPGGWNNQAGQQQQRPAQDDPWGQPPPADAPPF